MARMKLGGRVSASGISVSTPGRRSRRRPGGSGRSALLMILPARKAWAPGGDCGSMEAAGPRTADRGRDRMHTRARHRLGLAVLLTLALAAPGASAQSPEFAATFARATTVLYEMVNVPDGDGIP